MSSLLLTYLISIIGGVEGHGCAPIILFLFRGTAEIWLPGRVLGCIGIVGLVIGMALMNERPLVRNIWQLSFALVLYCSWIAFAFAEANATTFWEHALVHLILSLPFQWVFFRKAYLFIKNMRTPITS